MHYTITRLKKLLKENKSESYNPETDPIDLADPQTPTDHLQKYYDFHKNNIATSWEDLGRKTGSYSSEDLKNKDPQEYQRIKDLESNFGNQTLNLMQNPNTPSEILVRHMLSSPAHEKAFYDNPMGDLIPVLHPDKFTKTLYYGANRVSHPESVSKISAMLDQHLDDAEAESKYNAEKYKKNAERSKTDPSDIFKYDPNDDERLPSFTHHNKVQQLAKSLVTNKNLSPEDRLALYHKTKNFDGPNKENYNEYLKTPLNSNIIGRLTAEYLKQKNTNFSKTYDNNPDHLINHIVKQPPSEAKQHVLQLLQSLNMDYDEKNIKHLLKHHDAMFTPEELTNITNNPKTKHLNPLIAQIPSLHRHTMRSLADIDKDDQTHINLSNNPFVPVAVRHKLGKNRALLGRKSIEQLEKEAEDRRMQSYNDYDDD